MRTFICIAVALLTFCQIPVSANPDRDERMAWWREARFGMFVHWGLYSGLAGTWNDKPVATRGGMEWIQQRVRADTDTYAQAAMPLFKPTENFAEQWAALAAGAGCRYLVFTTKHHDGFALHDSKVSAFDAGTVLKRDLVREITDAARAHGLKIGFYHSVIDWHHDQYAYARSQQLPHPLKGKPYPNRERNHATYVDYLHAQATELATNYGPVDIVWWDYSSQDFQGQEAWRAFDLMDMFRKQQPQVIMNNRLFRIPEAGWKSMGTAGFGNRLDPVYGDFITPEQHIPATGMPGVDWETCMTMNTTWGFSRHDQAWKTSETLVHNLIDIASKGGNYLLNIGPRGDGTVPEQSVQSLRDIGSWMKVNGEAIYGTTASLFDRLEGGRSTTKTHGDGSVTLYFHQFNWPEDGTLVMPGLKGELREARLLGQGPVEAGIDEGRLRIEGLPPRSPAPYAGVIAVTFKARPEVFKVLPGPDASGRIHLVPGEAVLHGGLKLETTHGPANIGYWLQQEDYISWTFRTPRAARYRLVGNLGCKSSAAGARLNTTVGEVSLESTVVGTGPDWTQFKIQELGTLDVDAGEQTLTMKALTKPGEAVVNVRGLVLEPVE